MNLPFHGKCIYHPKHNKEIMNNQLTKPFIKSMPKGSYKKNSTQQIQKFSNYPQKPNNQRNKICRGNKGTKASFRGSQHQLFFSNEFISVYGKYYKKSQRRRANDSARTAVNERRQKPFIYVYCFPGKIMQDQYNISRTYQEFRIFISLNTHIQKL